MAFASVLEGWRRKNAAEQRFLVAFASAVGWVWAARLAASYAAKLQLDQPVGVREEEGRVIIKATQGKSYDLAALVAGITDENRHEVIEMGRTVAGRAGGGSRLHIGRQGHRSCGHSSTCGQATVRWWCSQAFQPDPEGGGIR